jgi:hypothetical protein
MATWREKFNKKYGKPKDASNSRAEIAKLTGVSSRILGEVYKRGVGAWKTNIASVRLKSGQKAPNAPRSAKMGKEQWAMARIYSFVMGGTTRRTADKDLWEKHLKSKK